MSRTNIRAYNEEEVRKVTECSRLIGFHAAVVGPMILGCDSVVPMDGNV